MNKRNKIMKKLLILALLVITSCYAPRGVIASKEASMKVIGIQLDKYRMETAYVTLLGEDRVARYIIIPIRDTSRFWIGKTFTAIIKR